MPRSTQRGLPDDYLSNWSARHDAAEATHREISALAFPGVGPDPGPIETFAGEDPSALGFSAPRGVPMISREKTLQKWEVPDLPPSHHSGFGSSVAHNYPPTEAQAAAGKTSSSNTLSLEANKLATRMGTNDPFEQVVTNRKNTLLEALASEDNDASWYQGKAQALIHSIAQDHGVSDPTMRKTTVSNSARMKWDMIYADNAGNRKLGRANETTYPNALSAGEIVDAAKGRDPEEAATEVVERGIAGVQRQAAARVASRMLSGDLRGHDPLPISGEGEKLLSFDVNTSDPTHPEYGYSPWVHRHQLSAHTPDVQDARAGGYHEDQLEMPRPTNPETGKPIGKPHHEEMLSKPAGADIAQSTALVARADVFHQERAKRGDAWARENALDFLAGPSQSMQWSVARRDPKGKSPGVIDLPASVLERYEQRPKGRGFRTDGGMSTEDWAGI